MDRPFLDANVLFSAAYRPGAGLLQLWDLPETVLLTSRYALEEARVNLDTEEQRVRLAELTKRLETVPEAAAGAELPAGVELPEKDHPVLLAALGAGATHLITGDLRHFGRYFGKRIGSLIVLPPAAYLRLRSRG